ncbi:MAG: pyrroloquinoline-quinone synthase PqqC [Janthinobacterium lividum]
MNHALGWASRVRAPDGMGGAPGAGSAMSPDGLEAALRDIGARRYHNLHPFHRMLHSGQCTRAQVQAWALNRYLYQAAIPLKDASLIGRCDDPALRREWRRRLEDHDGFDGTDTVDGGVARWLALTDGLGIDRAVVVSGREALPATRFAVEAYIRFVRERPLLEAVASSLTELFSPQIIGERVSGMLAHYDYVTPATLAYFSKRPPQAARDSDFALAYVREHAVTAAEQQACLAALSFKCDVLWSMLDALYFAYVAPGFVPPGAYRPEDAAGVDPVAAGMGAGTPVTAHATVPDDLPPVTAAAVVPATASRPGASIDPQVRPRLAPGVRLHNDPKRGWVLLCPERVIETQGPTSEILRRCDGQRTLAAIVDELAAAFVADRAVIAGDVAALLQELATKKLVVL